MDLDKIPMVLFADALEEAHIDIEPATCLAALRAAGMMKTEDLLNITDEQVLVFNLTVEELSEH